MRTRRSSDVLVSTTEELDGWEVTEYLDVVSAHVVAGTNFFSDVAASFSDVFGGRSSSYKKQLEDINEEVTRELKEKAAQQGADALLGLKVDHDEISGQQKGMLMVTATGTAVRAERSSEPEREETTDESGPVSAGELAVESRTQRLLREVEEGTISVDEETWQFLIENRVEELAKPARGMLVGILKKMRRTDADKLSIKRGRDYFLAIDREVAKKHLYNMLHDHEPNRKRGERPVMEWALETMKEGQMLDYRWVRALLEEEKFLARKRALEVLAEVDKPYYTESDLEQLRELEERVSTGFEKRGEVLEVEESGMLSSETKEVWQIEEGVHNPMDREYCEKTGKNIYGFTKEETKPEEAAEAIRRKIEALEDLV
jgi:uncharacterized protein YbjQ (UPF0145 family)